MKPFTYVTARTPAAACELAGEGGRFIAGGVDLLGEMKEGLAAPARLVNVKELPGTRDLVPGDKQWTIGANVTLAALIAHPQLRGVFPALAEAAETVGSPQMRNQATVGGNLAQHSRCWYYRHRDLTCLKKGGKRCLAHGGENKYHSLYTKSQCLSPCVSNLAVALTALGATATVQRGGKTLTLTMADLYAKAWSSARRHNSLEPADLILRVSVPVVPGGRSTYVQMSEKRDFDWALVSCAVACRLEDGRLRGAHVVLGCVAPGPWEAKEANRFIEDRPPTAEAAAGAAEILLREAQPLEQNGYKVPLAQALVRRAVVKLAEADSAIQ
jgi:xanthine dehydrogenase YagS FAD-binding subunit